MIIYYSETDKKKEEAIIIRAIQDSNFSKLISEDAKLFQQLLEDIFPAAPKQRSESILLEVHTFIMFLVKTKKL